MKEFSNGANAQVYRLEPADREWPTAPPGTLYRLESLSSRPHFALGFYTHRIASILFPENFPKVIGARQHGTSAAIVSAEAPVVKEHAKYSSHSTHVGWGVKTVCDCRVCQTHHALHQQKDLEARAMVAAVKMEKLGIHVPAKDRTDYCINPETGDIIFFEVFVCIHQLRVSINNNLLSEELEELVVPSLDRLQELNRVRG